MSKYVTYLDLNDIKKIEIYPAMGKYTAKELRSRLGCDYIINGGLYTFSTMKPCCQLKINGTVFANDGYNYYSAVFNSDPKEYKHDIIPMYTTKYKNAIACVAFKNNGKVDNSVLSTCMNNTSISYATNHTAIGKKDGKLALYIGTDDMTSKQFYQYAESLGWSDILMLDGGGSTQGYIGAGKEITSSRKVHNYICIYMKKGTVSNPIFTPDTTPSSGYVSGKNPYKKPTRAIQYYTTGNDVKWVQYQLNVHGIKVDVDGSYGPGSVSAIKTFQKNNAGLAIDGSCGPATQAALAKEPGKTGSGVTVTTNPYRVDNNPYAAPSGAVQYGMTGTSVKWLQWMLNAHGYPVAIDGSFGPDCLSNLKEYQSDHGLSVDGSCGPATQASLKKA